MRLGVLLVPYVLLIVWPNRRLVVLTHGVVVVGLDGQASAVYRATRWVYLTLRFGAVLHGPNRLLGPLWPYLRLSD